MLLGTTAKFVTLTFLFVTFPSSEFQNERHATTPAKVANYLNYYKKLIYVLIINLGLDYRHQEKMSPLMRKLA